MPGMLKLGVDWAENFTLLHAREIQSEYWLLKQISLFIGIGELLCEEAWEASTSKLEIGSKATMTSIGSGMFWAEVVEAGGDREDSKYVVRDAQGAPRDFLRCELRARVWYTMTQTCVTNDKKHDSYATQHFMDLFIDQQIIEYHSSSAPLTPHPTAVSLIVPPFLD